MDLKSFVNRKDNYVCGLPFDTVLGKNGLGCFLHDTFLQHGNKIFQVHAVTAETETYSSVLKRSIRAALEMKSRGVTDNDVIVLCSGNSMDCFIPIFAAQLLNASVAALDPSQSVRDVVYLLNVIEPKMVFVENTSFDLIAEAKSQFCFETEIVVIGDHSHPVSFSEFLKHNPHEDGFKPKPVRHCNNTAFIVFSSGTTGMPKGICLSGYGVLLSSLATEAVGLYGNIVIHLTSFYWISALLSTLLTIVKGGRKVILPQYELDAFLKAVQDRKVSVGVLGSCVAYELSRESCSKYDLSSLELIVVGGSTISSDQLNKCREFLPSCIILPAYGLTETSGLTTAFPKQLYEVSLKYPSSCGIPTPGVTMKIVNPETEEILGVNQHGEIRIYTKSRFNEYYNKDSADAFDHEGFIKTGDIGYFDENNFLYICDRIKDMFKYKSWHIVPASVENVIYQHPAVKEAVVVGVPHPPDGDHPMALVVLKKEHVDTKEEELRNFVDERVLDREKLRGGLQIVKKFPRTPSGKISRTVVRKQAIERTL